METLGPRLIGVNVLRLWRQQLAPSIGLFVRLGWGAVFARQDGLCRPTVNRVMVMLIFLPALFLVQALHWLGFLLDEILFPRYRAVVVREPLFIVGVPRSGTTLLHRTLAANSEQFTTFKTWELLFGLSITARQLWLGAARLDRRVGRPGRRLIDWIQRLAFRRLDGIHDVSLVSPEEDYLALVPIAACFLLVIPFPFSEMLWRVSRFDRALSARDQQRIMSFYKLCLQKHLYVHGAHERLLSKNASFGSLVNALRDTFPDGRIICCLRDPAAAVPSVLNAVQPGLRMFDIDRRGGVFQARMLALMLHNYRHLIAELPRTPGDRHVFIMLDELHNDLATTVRRTFRRLGLDFSPSYGARLDKAAKNARLYRSTSEYSLRQFGLDERTIREEFDVFYKWRGQRVNERCHAKALPT